MNILFVSQELPYLPSTGGFRLYGANLIRHLSRTHRVDLISLLVDDDAAHLDWPRQHCDMVITMPTGRRSLPARAASAITTYVAGHPLAHRASLLAALHSHLRPRGWNVLHVEGSFAGGLIPIDFPLPRILSLHDAWTLRHREMLKCSPTLTASLQTALLLHRERRYQRLVYPRFDRCTVVAQRDLEEVQRVVPTARLELVPNGVDTDYFQPLPNPGQPPTLVFHGHLAYPPNIEAALELAHTILPRVRSEIPHATLHLVGARPDSRIAALANLPHVRVSADLPDIRPALSSNQVYVSTIRHGTGLKNKILEAMAMQLPIVCYPSSVDGLGAVHDLHLLIAQDADDLTFLVLGLLRNPIRAHALALSGRTFVETHYSWASAAQAYQRLYEQIMGERMLPGRPGHGHPSSRQ